MPSYLHGFCWRRQHCIWKAGVGWIISVIYCIINPLQYPVRPSMSTYDDVNHLSAKIKPKQQKVRQLTYPGDHCYSPCVHQNPSWDGPCFGSNMNLRTTVLICHRWSWKWPLTQWAPTTAAARANRSLSTWTGLPMRRPTPTQRKFCSSSISTVMTKLPILLLTCGKNIILHTIFFTIPLTGYQILVMSLDVTKLCASTLHEHCVTTD